MKKILFILFLTIPFISFGQVKEVRKFKKLDQEINKNLYSGIGDVILKITVEENMKNIFGKSDMFGRKVPSKTVELKYKGVEKNGDFTFIRKDVDFYNQKTTMNDHQDSRQKTIESDLEITLSPKDKIFPIEGYLIKIINFNKFSIEYSIEKQ